MKHLAHPQLWFVCGSQHLYGPETLKEVADHAAQISAALHGSAAIPLEVVSKGVLTTPDEIRALCLAANADPLCAGLILWMHTFSPSKMWIGGLGQLSKPFVHLHTQFSRDLPWASIDMDYMNLNQSAHGDREAGFLHTRLRLERKVVVGHWQDEEVQARLGAGRLGLERPPGQQVRALRRQHAAGGGDRGRQGLGRDPFRLLGQHPRGGRSRGARERGERG